MTTTAIETIVFSKHTKGFGTIELRPLDLKQDIATIYSWVIQPYATYWGMEDKSMDEVHAIYQEIENTGNHHAIMGFYNGNPCFLIEKYKASEDGIAEFYHSRESDFGMHILVAPTTNPITNFTWHVFTTTLDYFFNDNAIERIVVEPDVRNKKIHLLNKKAGFVYEKEIQLPYKNAALAFCDRVSYKKALDEYWNKSNDYKKDSEFEMDNLDKNIAHLQPEVWQKANKHLVAKAISEFAHEVLVQPKYEYTTNTKKYYSITTADHKIKYNFSAKKKALDHWEIDADSLSKNESDEIVSALNFITEFQETLGLPSNMIGVYLEEMASTLASLSYKFTHQKYTAKELVTQSFQEIEHAMIEGHPCFVANNGRIGFNADEYANYAPEANHNFQIIWLAGHKQKGTFTCIKGLDYKKVMQQELGKKKITDFNDKLLDLGLNIEDYIFIPVHPWQWKNKLIHVFASDIVNKQLVLLGTSEDEYSAQQSIRTLYNSSCPNKFYTKTALSILNMGFMRGLSPYYMQSTPPITEWISKLLDNDDYLQKTGFSMLGEVATAGYRNEAYEPLGRSSAYNKMLSALWRESPHSKIKYPDEKLMTMAAFLHKDKEGHSLLVALIKASPYDASTWIEKYLYSYLSPILHCFYTYEIVFIPHGENVIMVMENNTPKKILMKDITEEVIVFNEEMKLPPPVDRLFAKASDKMKVLTIFTDVFDSFFRFMSSILDDNNVLSENDFWKLVANCINQYQYEHPHLAHQFKKYDLFTATFDRCCLNRLQLKNTLQMLDLADPIESLILKGELKNPIAMDVKN